MIISVINRSESIADEQMQAAIRAVNRQISEDFSPYWGCSAQLRLEGNVSHRLDTQKLGDMRGEAVLYVWDGSNKDQVMGYHESNFRGIPFGIIYTQLCKQYQEPWTTTLSHEALELLVDPQGNLLVQGPHPEHPDKEVFHWYEVCDAVQGQTYVLDGIEVSNFVLPAYFKREQPAGTRNDFLSRSHKGKNLDSFGVVPGGYIGFYNPETQQHETYAMARDTKARARMQVKAQHQMGRGIKRKQGK